MHNLHAYKQTVRLSSEPKRLTDEQIRAAFPGMSVDRSPRKPVDGPIGRFVPLSRVPRGLNAGNYKIYALSCPKDGRVRYVGVTKGNLGARVYGHFQAPTKALPFDSRSA